MSENSKNGSDTKHNWFDLDGSIRMESSMSIHDFLDKLHEAGFEFLGKASLSEFKDSDYE